MKDAVQRKDHPYTLTAISRLGSKAAQVWNTYSIRQSDLNFCHNFSYRSKQILQSQLVEKAWD